MSLLGWVIGAALLDDWCGQRESNPHSRLRRPIRIFSFPTNQLASARLPTGSFDTCVSVFGVMRRSCTPPHGSTGAPGPRSSRIRSVPLPSGRLYSWRWHFVSRERKRTSCCLRLASRCPRSSRKMQSSRSAFKVKCLTFLKSIESSTSSVSRSFRRNDAPFVIANTYRGDFKRGTF